MGCTNKILAFVRCDNDVAINVTGIFLSKLDGTARGGIVFAIEDETGIPVKLVGIGERPDDVEPFDPETFVDALMDLA